MAKQFLAGFAVAAALAAAGWFLRVAPERAESARRASDAEESARRAGREAADAQHWAQSERDRNGLLDERVRELERLLTTTRPATADRDASGAAARSGDPPEKWDRTRIGQEIENLALAPNLTARHERYPLVLRALQAMGDAGPELVVQILSADFEPQMIATAATLAAGLRDAKSVPALVARWAKEKDVTARVAILRALASIPGDAQTELLRGVWTDGAADPNLRKFAIHGLALRGHELGRAAARGDGGATAAQRVLAIESLLAHASAGGFADATLIPVFGRALRTADGPPQRKLSLIALEGFWSKDAVPDLTAFADDPASPPELVLRARRLIADVTAGRPRPEGAGVPERGLGAEASGE